MLGVQGLGPRVWGFRACRVQGLGVSLYRVAGAVDGSRQAWGHAVPKARTTLVWDFPKITGTLFWGPDNKDPTI